jgi:ABC-2 type transport system permease protein
VEGEENFHMNPRGGRALIQRTWLSWMQHRSFFFLLAFMWMIPPLIYLFVWSSAAGGNAVGGFTRGEFVAYYIILIVVNQLTYPQTNWTVGDVIRYGNMNSLLLRPMSPVYDALASEIAGKVVYMVFIIPISAILTLILKPELDTSLGYVLVFIPALVLAWALRFFWGYWVALLAFWSTRADALLGLQDTLVFLLAGVVAPVELLPGFMQKLAVILPFRYMVGFPVEVLMGQLDSAALLTGFVVQTSWLFVSIILFLVIWRAGLRQYSAVGG